MTYSGQSDFYRIPYMLDGDILAQSEEQQIAQIFENQMRAAILSGGTTVVYEEGTYGTAIDGANRVTVAQLKRSLE